MNITDADVRRIAIEDLRPNEGQLESIGVHANPRQISKKDFEALKASLSKDNLTGVMPLKVFEHEGELVVLGGNMRLRALAEMGVKDVACVMVPPDTDTATLNKIIITDNSTFGEWDNDMLANEWDEEVLALWGVEVPKPTETTKLSNLEFTSSYYEPEQKPELRLQDCFDTTKYDQKIAAIEAMDLPTETKEVLRVFAYRFIKIDFESVANYYAFNASDDEKQAIERLRLVLVDGGINGFVEDDLLRLHQLMLVDND